MRCSFRRNLGARDLSAYARGGVSLMLALCTMPSLHAADLYRLTDEYGKMIYTDQLLPSQTKKGYGVLDSQGREKNLVAPEVSAEVRAEQERQRSAQEESKRVADEHIRRESLLLQLYGSEGAIKEARESMLQTTEGKRNIHMLNISSMQARIDVLLDKAAQGKPQSKELVELKKSIAAEKVAMQQVDAEKDAVNAHFDKIQARWRIAKARHESLNPKVAPSMPVTDSFLLLSPTPQSPKPDNSIDPEK